MNNEIKNLKNFSIKNPDNEFINFYKVPYKVAIDLIAKNEYKEDSITLYGINHSVYVFKNSKVLFEKTLDKSYYFLFNDLKEYNKFISGKSYWNVFVDFKGDDIYSSFGLECDITSDLIKKSIKSDPSYQIHDNTQQYTLYYLSDGSVCFLTHRINDWYDGYWFSSFDQFKFIYNNVLNL